MKDEVNPHTIVMLKALADEVRLSAAKFVAASNEAVPSCNVIQSCSKRLELSQPAMSHHFKKLVDADILINEKRGTQNFYRFNRELVEGHGIDIDKL